MLSGFQSLFLFFNLKAVKCPKFIFMSIKLHFAVLVLTTVDNGHIAIALKVPDPVSINQTVWQL